MNVLIAGGGTAGHVNPAIALAGALDGHRILFLGTEKGVEARLVPEAGFELATIEVKGFDRSKPLSIFGTGAKAVKAVGQARKIAKGFRPDVVVGMGGYVSLPACLAARSADAKVVLHEQNIVFGLAHRLSMPLATRVAVSFEDTMIKARGKGVYTGNPVLPSLANLDRPAARRSAYETFSLDEGRKTLLIFGGSLGARSINAAATGLTSLWKGRADVQVLHVTGRSAYDSVIAAAQGAPEGFTYRIVPYVEDMGLAYAVADLALCRGGATTVAELCVVGVPSIIVPYPYHRDRQQERHGRVLERAGAARVLLDDRLSAEVLSDIAGELLNDDGALEQMASSARGLGRRDAAQELARVVKEVV